MTPYAYKTVTTLAVHCRRLASSGVARFSATGSVVIIILTLAMATPSASSIVGPLQSTLTTCAGTGIGPPYVYLDPANVSGLEATIGGYAVAGAIPYITWNWGDGQTTTGYFPQSHTYAEAGTYEVIVTVYDCTGGGKTTSASETVTVGLSSSSTSSSVVSSSPVSSSSSSSSSSISSLSSSSSASSSSSSSSSSSLTTNPSATTSPSQLPLLIGILAVVLIVSSLALALYRRGAPRQGIVHAKAP